MSRGEAMPEARTRTRRTAARPRVAGEPASVLTVSPSDPRDPRTLMLPGDLHLKPGHLIRRAQQISVSIFFDECRSFDITPMQYAVMKVLASTADLDQITLAHRAALDRSTIGGLAERLEEKGWIRRMPGTEDRRQKLLSLTDEGRRVLAAVEPAVERTQQRILAPLSPDESRIFVALLEKLVDENNEASRAPFKDGP